MTQQSKTMKKTLLLLILVSLLGACSPTPTSTGTAAALPASQTPTLVNTATPTPPGLWISPASPPALRDIAMKSGIPLVNDAGQATLLLDITDSATAQSNWIYALAAPFPTLTDEISSADLLSTWQGVPAGPLAGRPLLMAESTYSAFAAIWGKSAPGVVNIVPPEQLLPMAWGRIPSYAIIPFESIEPQWKVLAVGGQSPIHKNFDAGAYPLKVGFGLSDTASIELPATNRDPAKLTTVILTGVTALWAATSYIMEIKGITYPGSSIRDVLREADITHISNEIPFDEDCPFPNPGETSLAILCSKPKYMELFTDVGMDIVELTGDHFNNRGVDAMLETIEMYRQIGVPYYGGGTNIEDSIKPLLIGTNGNKFAFIGCNAKLNYPHATETIPGAAPCLFDYMTAQIRDLRAQGYLPIVTFQDYEYYSPEARPGQIERFHMMADAGAVLVSGSQAHYPQMMEFYNGVFLHYGLGNLFYDQMTYTLSNGDVTDRTRHEFIDRHVFYDGRYLGTEILTAILMDYARPQWMNEKQRTAFLSDYFYDSGWIPFSPTPRPAPTVTLTPIQLPNIVTTPTP